MNDLLVLVVSELESESGKRLIRLSLLSVYSLDWLLVPPTDESTSGR